MKTFVPVNSVLISREVEGHGLGFPHVGLHRVGVALGYGWPNPAAQSIQCVYSETLKAWDGVSPKLIGWFVEVK